MKNKKIRNICIALLVLVLFIYIVIIANSLMNKTKVGFFSTKIYIMSSDSPEADIYSGDLVFAKNVQANEIQENDNIIFDRNNKLIVKKVTKVENKNGTNNFFIEEDETISNEKLENAQIIGKVVSKAPGVGNVAMFIQSPIGTLNVLIIIVCIIIIIKKINKEILNSENNYTEENRKVDEEEDGKEECNKEE